MTDFEERSISLTHPGFRAPLASSASDALRHLTAEGYSIVMDPMNEDPLVDQYINREFAMSAGRENYVAWRNSYPKGHFFVMSNYAGGLAAANLIAPRYSDERQKQERISVPTMAIARANLYENNVDMAALFLTVTHALAYRRFKAAKQGIMMEGVKSTTLQRACLAIGYKAARLDMEEMDIKSGNRGVDMVVSSGPLKALNVSRMEDTPLPPAPEAPQLRIIKGNMGD